MNLHLKHAFSINNEWNSNTSANFFHLQRAYQAALQLTNLLMPILKDFMQVPSLYDSNDRSNLKDNVQVQMEQEQSGII